METTTKTTGRKIEIAYVSYDREGRAKPARTKIVRAERVEAECAKLEERGCTVYGTREAE